MAIAILESAAADHSEEAPKKKSPFKKYALIALAVLVCVAVTVTLDLVIFRVKTPKFRLVSVAVNDLSFANTTTSASFDISLDAVYAVKNPNYGPFEYRGAYVNLLYRGKRVGRARIVEGKAKALSTTEVGFRVSVSSWDLSAGTDLGRDIGSGMVWLSVGSQLRGEVELIKDLKCNQLQMIAMAEGQKSGYDGHPLAPTNGYARSDAEAATTNTEELRRQKRKKYLIYFAAFVIFQTLIIVLFSLTVMKVKTPKFRVRSTYLFNTLDVPQTNNSFNAQFGVKNTNFGPYKYDSTTVSFLYNGIQVGSAFIPKSKANFLSTKKINVPVDLNLSGTSNSEFDSDEHG
ncbi:hypothetical protein C3L33_03282, partial [Rhododendron williamsianum]